MKVRATRLGYYDHKRRYPSDHPKGKGGRDVFTLVPIKIKKDGKEVIISPEQQFSSEWMEKVEDNKGKGKSEAKAPKQDNESDDEVI